MRPRVRPSLSKTLSDPYYVRPWRLRWSRVAALAATSRAGLWCLQDGPCTLVPSIRTSPTLGPALLLTEV